MSVFCNVKKKKKETMLNHVRTFFNFIVKFQHIKK